MAILENGTLDVVEKYRLISEAALGTDSIYMRAKDTFKELLDDKNLTGAEYAEYASQFISQLATSTTQSAMNTAMQWSQHEKENAYALALTKANIDVAVANEALIQQQILASEKEVESKCAQITATLAQSIRENGTVATYAADGCTPLTLNNNGVKYAQTKAQEANMYATLSDAYRKSGVVQIGTDADGVIKAMSGDAAGYTNAQDKFARRQLLSFEDSKRTHAANAVSQLMGQLLASEIIPAESYVAQWNAALSYLTSNTPAS